MIMLSGRGLRSSVRRAYARCKPAAWRTTQEAYLLAGHDDLLIENLGLSTDSVVIEVGGYQGAYVAAIIERYGCTVHVFEPVDDFYAQLCQRFGTDPRIRLHPYGLAAVDAKTTFQLAADATGGSSSGGRTVPVQLRAVATVINELPPSVDVMTINIEGAEYEVLRAMAEAGILSRVQRLHVQFHDDINLVGGMPRTPVSHPPTGMVLRHGVGVLAADARCPSTRNRGEVCRRTGRPLTPDRSTPAGRHVVGARSPGRARPLAGHAPSAHSRGRG